MPDSLDKEYLSQEKFEELKNELNTLKTVRRKEVAESLEYARSLGDLSENAEYQEARELQSAIEERIAKLEEVLQNAEIVKHSDIKSDIVSMGSKVTIQKKGEKDNHKYELVGSEEANMMERKISYMSPLGEAMIGKKKDDEFTFETPNGKQQYKIVTVE